MNPYAAPNTDRQTVPAWRPSVGVWLVFVAASIVCWISIWPGILASGIFFGLFLSFLLAPFVLAMLLVVMIALAHVPKRDGAARAPTARRNNRLAMAAIVGITFFLIIVDIPRRLAFWYSLSAFEAAVADSPVSDHYGENFGRRLGIFFVDQRATDPNGGVYFRVYATADGLGPDTMSYGFAKQPNRSGTPFGAAHYETYHLMGDWYCFHASNDCFAPP